jgi:hypothetical protein
LVFRWLIPGCELRASEVKRKEMQSKNFVALAGHLNEYPLCDLISILRRGRKSGRLIVEYPIGPCSFYFIEGNLVDAQLNSLSGLQAVLVALAQPNASFNFNPLIQPPRQSIGGSSQKVIFELLGCWEEKEMEVSPANVSFPENGRAVSLVPTPDTPVMPSVEFQPAALPSAREPLALPPSSLERVNARRHRQVLIASAVISLVVSFLTVALLTRWFIKRDDKAAVAEMGKKESADGVLGEEAGANARIVRVTVRVEQGRVTQASIENHQPGSEAYEAMALKVARERHYAPSASGQETIPVRINSHG